MNQKNSTINQIGEFGLINRIQKILSAIYPKDVIMGIGDDTAVIKIDQHRSLLATCDIQIEGIHFRLTDTTPYQLGKRCIAINLSDIAAMGGRPTFALVSLGLPPNTETSFFDQLFEGMRDQMAIFQAYIIGGNLAESPNNIIIDITMLGEINTKDVILRNGAKDGDRIFVTGEIGTTSAGFQLLQKFTSSFPDEFSAIVNKHLNPIPRIEIGQALAQSGYITSMIDISDGLVSELFHIAEQSHVGFTIFQSMLPVNIPDKIGKIIGKNSLELSLYGGEDYELLFTTKADIPLQFIQAIVEKYMLKITEIGTITVQSEGCWLVDDKNKKHELGRKGWDHFKNND